MVVVVVLCVAVVSKKELEFTMERINKNLSKYSDRFLTLRYKLVRERCVALAVSLDINVPARRVLIVEQWVLLF